MYTSIEVVKVYVLQLSFQFLEIDTGPFPLKNQNTNSKHNFLNVFLHFVTTNTNMPLSPYMLSVITKLRNLAPIIH